MGIAAVFGQFESWWDHGSRIRPEVRAVQWLLSRLFFQGFRSREHAAIFLLRAAGPGGVKA
jgi:hypothetical protein